MNELTSLPRLANGGQVSIRLNPAGWQAASRLDAQDG